MTTDKDLEQQRLAELKKAQDIQFEIRRKEKIEKQLARKRDTHEKIVMGGALVKALGVYLDKDEVEIMVEWFNQVMLKDDGQSTYTLAEDLIEFISNYEKDKK